MGVGVGGGGGKQKLNPASHHPFRCPCKYPQFITSKCNIMLNEYRTALSYLKYSNLRSAFKMPFVMGAIDNQLL